MPTIFVDDRAIEAKTGDNLLEVLLSNGIDVPYFCWHPAMGSVGACRQCAVVGYANPDDTRGRIIMSCMTPVTEGARFSGDAENATSVRNSVVGPAYRPRNEPLHYLLPVRSLLPGLRRRR